MPLLPLEGMRVVDVTTSIAGPYCAEILAALGADVVKVERPDTGDDGRAWGPPFWNGESAMFLAVNAGKRSLAVSLRDERGREAVLRLADRADVFLQSLRPGLAERLGLGPERAARPQPAARLLLGRRVRARRSASRGAGLRRADAGGRRPHQHDRRAGPTGRARRLVADRHGHRDVGRARDRRRAARARAHRRGRARRHVAVRDRARLHRLPPRRLPRRRHRADARRARSSRWSRRTRCFPTRDGELMVAGGNDRLFAALCGVLELPGLVADERFRTNPDRVRNREELVAIVSERLRTRPSGEWHGLLTDAGVPAAPVADVADVGESEQTQALGMLAARPASGDPGSPARRAAALLRRRAPSSPASAAARRRALGRDPPGARIRRGRGRGAGWGRGRGTADRSARRELGSRAMAHLSPSFSATLRVQPRGGRGGFRSSTPPTSTHLELGGLG